MTVATKPTVVGVTEGIAFDLPSHIAGVLAMSNVHKATVFLAWSPDTKLCDAFASNPHLTLATGLSDDLTDEKTIVFCGAETLIGFRKLLQWYRQGARELVVFAVPEIYTRANIVFWLRKAAAESIWRRLEHSFGSNAGAIWALLHRGELARSLSGPDSGVSRDSVDRPQEEDARPIVLTIESLGRGGAEKQILLRATELTKSGEPVALIINDPDQSRMTEESQDFQVFIQESVRDLFETGGGLGLAAKPQLASRWHQLLRVLPADIWQATYLAASSISKIKPKSLISYLDWTNVTSGLAAILCGVSDVRLSFRNVAPSYFAFHRLEFLAIYQVLATAPSLSFEANSQAGADSYANWLGMRRERIMFRPNFEGQPSPPKPNRRRSGNGNVGWLGRYASEKDPLLWLSVVSALCRDFPSAGGVMVGQGPLERVVGDEIRSRGLVDRITVKGVTTEPEEFLAQVDLLLMTSKYEGRPNVVAEAASLATPVVSTNAGDVKLIAADLAGVTVVDSRDPEVLALALTNKGAA